MKGVHGLLPVVIVDEAHLLGRDMLEEIRFLLNVKKPHALILAGQTEIWEKLKLLSYAAIRQRIDVQCGAGHMDRQKPQNISKPIWTLRAVRKIFSPRLPSTISSSSPAAFPASSTKPAPVPSSTAHRTANPLLMTAWRNWSLIVNRAEEG